MKESIDVLISFDTTGSMSPCIAQVRSKVVDVINELFTSIPELRIGIISHGDYCDGDKCITSVDLTNNQEELVKFVKTAPNTHGGDCDECYELVLNHARSANWSAGKNKALILIGDANPHKVGYTFGKETNKLDWKNEAQLLVESGVNIYPVQALGRSSSNSFYQGLADISSTCKLSLIQFSDIVDIIQAVCYQRAGQLSNFETKLSSRKVKPSNHVLNTIDVLAKRKTTRKSNLVSRFQVLDILENVDIKGFVEENGITFNIGRGFYQWNKTETIQKYKDVVAQNNTTGEILFGIEARKVLNLPTNNTDIRDKPKNNGYTGFIQSTSVNRKLIAGTKFLYELSDYEK